MAGHSGGKWLVIISFLFTLGIILPAHATQQDPDALIIQPLSTAIYLNAVDPEAVSSAWVSPWITMLDKSGFVYEVALDNDEFIFNHLNEYDFVILPNITCLNLTFQNYLDNYLKQGGGIIFTGAFGCRDSVGSWQGCSFIERYFGASPHTNQLESNQPLDLIMRRTAPGGMAATAGFRLHFVPNQTPLQLMPDTTRATVGGYWQSSGVKGNQNNLKPAFVYSQVEETGGRIAWFGTNLDTLIVPTSEEKRTTQFFKQLFKWTGGKGIAKVDVYPENYESAFIINAQVKNPNPDFISITEQLDDLNIKPVITLFTPLSPAQKGKLTQKIDTDFDLILDLTKEKSVSPKQAQNYIQELLSIGVKVTGLSIPPELADSAFLSLAHDYQIPFLLIDSVVTAPYPHKIDPRFSTLVIAGPVINFSTLAENYSVTHPDSILNQMITLLERNTAIGGILRFNIDFNNANPPAITALLKDLAKYSRKNDDIWLTTLSEVAERMNVSDKIEISASDEPDGMKIFATSRNLDTIKNYTIRVLPQSPLIPEMSMISDLSANCTHSVKNGFFLIDLPKTATNETFTAKFIPRGGVTISANSQGVFSLIFKIAFFASVLFVGAFIWYFTSSKRQPSNVLSPDGKELAHPHIHNKLKPLAKKPVKQKDAIEANRPIHRPVLSISPERVFSSIPFPDSDDEDDGLDDTEIDVLNAKPAHKAKPIATAPMVSSAHNAEKPSPIKPHVEDVGDAGTQRMKMFAHLKAREYQDVRRRKLSEKYEPLPNNLDAPEENITSKASLSKTSEPVARSTVALDWLKEPESGFTDQDIDRLPAPVKPSEVENPQHKTNLQSSSNYFRSRPSVTAKLPRPESSALSRLKQGEKISTTSSIKHSGAMIPIDGRLATQRKKPQPAQIPQQPVVNEGNTKSGLRSTASLPHADIPGKSGIAGHPVPKTQALSNGSRVTAPLGDSETPKATAQLPRVPNPRRPVLPELTKTNKNTTRSTAPLPAKEPKKTDRQAVAPGSTRKITAPLPPKQKVVRSASTPSPKKKVTSRAKTSADIVAAKSKPGTEKSSDWL